MTQGEYIKSLLKSRKIRFADIAKEMGITQSTFSNKIHGYRVFKKNEIEILLKVLDMKYEEVFSTNSVNILRDDEVNISIGSYNGVINKTTASEVMATIKRIEGKRNVNINY